MQDYPINLRIAGRSCVVIGGGTVAARKVVPLLAAGGHVTIISPAMNPLLQKMAEAGEIEHVAKAYETGDLKPFFLVICAADNPVVNARAAREAHSLGILVNVTDDPEQGNFIVPAQVARGRLLFTVSTGGQSPALARRLREELEERYGVEYGTYLELIAQVRSELKQKLPAFPERERFWRELIDRDVLTLLREGRIKEAEERIRHATGCIGTES
ncbi:precorrin-2 dehydrogenase/sirohydrochlorin ferrochelatase family protein [Lucifera butyrica]|nr:bifunctional precorrin-2 dehydrogenase/sirohydrochlorin ferrochelatase [Lucifera butyrica]